MMPKPLLPPNASTLEVATDNTSAPLEKMPVPIRDIWNPDTCPVRLLPYLAWAFSVDRWDKDWPEQTKRDVIKSSMFVHQHKGTIGAIRRAIEPLGYLVHVKEWWKINDTPGVFQVNIGIVNTGMSKRRYHEIAALIFENKPASRHLTGLNIEIETTLNVYWGAVSFTGSAITVYPYRPPLDPTRYPPFEVKAAAGFQLATATNQAKPLKHAVGMAITQTLTAKKPVKNAIGMTINQPTTGRKPVKHAIGYLLVIKDIA